MDEYTTFDIKRIIGIKMERLQDWMKKGFVKPSRQESVARGKKSYFSLTDLYLIKTFQFLINNGIQRKVAAKWLDDVREHLIRHKKDAEYEKKIGRKTFEAYYEEKPTMLWIVKKDSVDLNEIDLVAPESAEYAVHISNQDDPAMPLDMDPRYEIIHAINFKKITDWVDSMLEG